MKIALAISVLFSLALALMAQPRSPQPVTQAPPPAAGPNLNAILADLQRTTQAANADLSKLRIEKWKVDEPQKQQMQQVAESLRKNITLAVPGLINEAQAAPGSVSKVFKLYHDLNVAYEYLNSLAEAAGAYGKKDEYTPLAGDASALDNARQNLSSYIEQAANTLETQLRQAMVAQQQQQQQARSAQPPKKIIIDNDNPAPNKKAPRKKKPAPAPTPTPSQSSPTSSQ
jgi:hypothetical protein